MKFVNVVFICAVLLFSVGFASATDFPYFENITDITTGDNTPSIEFTVIGNCTTYVCNLFINGTPSGVGTISNNTFSSITCNRTLIAGTYTYNVSAYNATEIPTLTYSTAYSITYSTFHNIAELVRDIIPAISALKDIVMIAGTILILLIIVIGLRDMFGDFISEFGAMFKKKK